MSYRFGHIELFARDPEASRCFYVDALGARLVADQGRTQWVEIGGAVILLRPGAPEVPADYRRAAEGLVLYCADAAQLEARLQQAGVETGRADQDDCVTFQDLDGHWWQAVTMPESE